MRKQPARGSRKGSPGEQRADPQRQRSGDATDSGTEQGHEVPSGSHPVRARWQEARSDAGTAVREGKALEGEASAGKPSSPTTYVWHGRGGNLMNLMLGCGMQQARGATGGVNRHGGEEPRRRPVWGDWLRHTEAHLGAWERTPSAMSMERRSLDNPMEGARQSRAR